MLPSFGVVAAQSNADDLVLETFLSVSDMSGPAQILGSRSRQRWPRAIAATAGAAVLRRAARAVTTSDTDTRGHVRDIVQSIHSPYTQACWPGTGQRRMSDGLDTTSCYYILQR